MKINRILNILIALLIIVLVAFFFADHYRRAEYARQAEVAEKEASANRMPSDENAINLIESINPVTNNDSEIFLSYESFLKNCTRTSHYVGETSVSYRFSRTLTSGGANIYLLNFKMRAEDESAQITVNFGIEHTYYVTGEWRDFYVPCTKGKIDSIKITLKTPFQKIYLSDLNVMKYDPLLVDFHYIKNGSYSVDGIPSYVLNENDGIGVGKTMDVVGDGEYLYSAGDEKLTISTISDNGTKVVSTLEGIGNVRHLEIRDTNHLVAASRETGVFIINITDKSNPYIESYYDSLETANDVCFSGNYMIVAGRYFGVEIVDITDVSHPVYITRIVNDKECFRCAVNGEYLFVSCWATGEVEIYDISTLNEPVLVNSISVTGRCAETFIDGNTAYIVSGYSNFVNADEVGDAGYGTGNSLAIYDISDGKHPVWQSTIKTEGALYGNGYDDWSVQVSNGYAYFTNSFGGMYIYNVQDVKKPVAVAHIAVEIPNSSSNYIDFSQLAKTVFPFDPTEKLYSPIMGVHIDKNKIYFASSYNDVYEFAFNEAEPVTRVLQSAEFKLSEKKSVATHSNYISVLQDCDVYRLAKYNNNYIAATGDGLLLLDEDLSVLGKYDTDYPVKDVCITSAGVIVTAETKCVSVYILNGNEFVRTGVVQSQASNVNVSSLGVTGDGNFAVVQSSWTKYELVDLRDINNPSLLSQVVEKNGKTVSANSVTNVGNMYYRNIVTGTVDGAVGIGGNTNMIWFESKNGSLCVRTSYPNVLGAEINGNAVMQNGEEVLSIYYNGLVVYNPFDATETSLARLEPYYVSNVRLKGKISIKDKILAVCNAPSGVIQIVNIGDPTNPYLLASCNVEESPGIALIEDGYVLVPMRHGGIIRINIE